MAKQGIWDLVRAAAAAAMLVAGATEAAAQVSTVVEFGGAKLSVTAAETKALIVLSAALHEGRGSQDPALAEARRAARGADARYWLALLELELGRLRQDDALRAPALDRLIASRMTVAKKLVGYLDVRGGIAFRAGDFALAGTHWARLLTLRPNDPDVLGNLAQVRIAQGDSVGAAELLARSVAARENSGSRAPVASYRQRLTIAQNGPAGTAAAAGRALVAAYPTPDHWRDALVVYRQTALPSGGLEIDLLRLMRAVGALARRDEYLRLAQLLKQSGQAAEAKAVLAEGLARGLLAADGSPTREIIAEVERAVPQEIARLLSAPTADSLTGAGRYSEAEARYRASLASGGSDPGEVNTRLGMLLVRSGRRSEAEAAFRAAAQTERYAEIAQFWLLWLAQP